MVLGLAVIAALGLGSALSSGSGSAVPASASSGQPPAGAGEPLPADRTRWLRVLDGLDGVRSTAYERGDTALLVRVWAPGARLRSDTAQLRALVASGCTARGVRHRFGALSVLATSGRRVRLRVVQWLPAPQRLRGGRVVGPLAGTRPTAVPVDLVATDQGWRLG